MKFTDDKEKQSAIEILKQGRKTEFWRLIVEAMKESKEVIQKTQDGDDIADLPSTEYKLQNEIYKVKKEFLDTLVNTPENIISWLEEPDNVYD